MFKTTFNSKNIIYLGLLILAFSMAIFTQCYQLLNVPGFHFDEAWQANYAYKILTQKNFWPLQAMNGYTTPVVHYFLALVFKFFPVELSTLRLTFVAINLITLLLLVTLLIKLKRKNAALWMVVLWALLPVSIHNHRFNVELTSFYGLFFVGFLWGIYFYKRNTKLSLSLIYITSLLATYSHILFITTLLSLFFYCAFYERALFFKKSFQRQFAFLIILILPLIFNMARQINKVAPWVLLGLLLVGSLVLMFAKAKNFISLVTHNHKHLIINLLSYLAIPFLFFYIFYVISGFWPYAQATGTLQHSWMLFNAVIFLIILYKNNFFNFNYFTLEKKVWFSFVVVFALTHLIILKQSSRYYTIPLILSLMWLALSLEKYFSQKKQVLIAIALTLNNLWLFQNNYIQPYLTQGATALEFKSFIFHDNAKDFRPFQKAYQWLVSQGCQHTLEWVEDDRFGMQVDFLKISAPYSFIPCPWTSHQLFFSHIPNYDKNFSGVRTDQNTPPPFANVEILYHQKDWGDLAFFTRRKELKK